LRDSGKYSRGYFLRRGPAAEIGRARAVRKRLLDGPFEMARGAGVSQVLDELELLLPHLVGRNGVALVAHRHAFLAVRLCPLEGCPDDPRDALARIHFFSDMLVAAGSSATEVLTLGVLAEDRDVDALAVLQRRQIGMQQ